MMDQALLVSKTATRQVDAKEFSKAYRNLYADFDLLCPVCRQAVYFAEGRVQNPHFRHDRDNSRARQCELYAANYGRQTPIEQMPIPLLLKRVGSDTYRVFASLRPLEKRQLQQFSRVNAMLVVGTRRYAISRERFSAGRVCILEMGVESLGDFGKVEIQGAPTGLDSYWGKASKPKDSAVFTCDNEDTKGRLLRSGDFVFRGMFYLIVSDVNSIRIIQERLRGTKVIGRIDGSEALIVLKTQFASQGMQPDVWTTAWLKEHDLAIGSLPETPEVLWPPSASSRGVSELLFSRGDAFIIKRTFIGSGGRQTDAVQVVRPDRKWREAPNAVDLSLTPDGLFAYGEVSSSGYSLICPNRGITLDALVCMRHPIYAMYDPPDNAAIEPLRKSLDTSGDVALVPICTCRVLELDVGGKLLTKGNIPVEGITCPSTRHLLMATTRLHSYKGIDRILLLQIPSTSRMPGRGQVAACVWQDEREEVRMPRSVGIARAVARQQPDPREILMRLRRVDEWRPNIEKSRR